MLVVLFVAWGRGKARPTRGEVVLVLLTLAGIRAAGRGQPRREPAEPRDLSSSLADVDAPSTEEALRRLAAADQSADPAASPSAKEPNR